MADLKACLGEEGDIFSYVLAADSLKPGDIITSGADAPLKPGNTLKLNYIPAGMKIHNIELTPGKGGQMCRSAGCSGSLVQKGTDGFGVVRLPSGIFCSQGNCDLSSVVRGVEEGQLGMQGNYWSYV